MMRRQEQHQSRVFHELSALILNIIRSPPTTLSFSGPPPPPHHHHHVMAQITPAEFASLLLGISVALMVCGSITFLIGFLLMPWVIGLMMIFYVFAIVSGLSMLGRALLCCTSTTSTRKEPPSWKLE